MAKFIFTSPSGRKYEVTGPDGANEDDARQHLDELISSGKIAELKVGTEKGRKSNTIVADVQPKPKKTTSETVAKYGAEVMLGLGKSAAQSVGEIVGSAVAPIVGTVVGIGQDVATRFGDNQGSKSPMQVRQEVIDFAAPRTKTGKVVNKALETVFYPVSKVSEFATDAAKSTGAPDIYATAVGDAVGLYTGAKYAQGLGKAAGVVAETSPVKAYDAAANAVYNAQVKARDFLRDKEAITPPGKVRSIVTSAKRTVNALGSDAGANTASIGALFAGNPLAVVPIQVARHLRKRGAENFGKAETARKSGKIADLAEDIKADISTPINPAVPALMSSSEALQDLIDEIKNDITITEE